MNIGVDARSVLKAQRTGIGYYTLNLIRHLAGLDTENKYHLYSRRRPFSRRKKLPPLPGKNFRHLVNCCNLPDGWFLKRLDVFHTSAYDILPEGKVKKIVTVHDLIPKVSQQTGENWHPSQVVEEFDHLIRNVLSKADKIIVTSNNTENDLKHFYSYDYSKVTVIPMGVDQSFSPISDNQKEGLYKNLKIRYNVPQNYLLYVGTIEPRKNVTGLINGYSLLKRKKEIPHKLVVAGMKGWMCDDVFQTVARGELGQEIIFTGYVPDEDLRALYGLAAAFIYPSLYEGFGLPVLEAMACGTPVVASNTGAISEVAGQAALLCDSKDPDHLAQCIGRVLDDKTLAAELVRRGLERALVFDWTETARKTLSVYNEVDT